MVQKEDNSNTHQQSRSRKSGQPTTCRKQYTNTQILIHNIPLFSMYVLGIIIIGFFNIILAVGFIIYLVISNCLFMYLICAYCPHYGTRSSLCGYGLVTKKITVRKSVRGFNNSFKKYIGVIFPNWFLPLIIGIYLLYISLNWVILILIIIFIIVAFIGVPLISKSKSCDTCKLKNNCPWMSLCSSKN